MSDRQKWRRVCRTTVAIPFDAVSCCSAATPRVSSPIDEYLCQSSKIMLLGTRDALEQSDCLARLILLGVVSEVESFFKHLIGGCVRLCALCRTAASRHVIPFAAVDYYADEIEYALLESVSFASSGEITSQTKKLTGLDVASPELKAAILQFDQVCHFRHASVHASGLLGVGNVREISQASTDRLQVDLKFGEVQTIVAICHNLVREYNRALFFQLIERWKSAKVLTGSWDRDRDGFTAIYSLFYCFEDSVGASNAYQAYRSLRPEILKRLAKGS